MKKTCLALAILALAITGCDMDHQDHAAWNGKDKEENEVNVPIEQVPTAVRATLESEAPGVAIKDVDKEADDGKNIYEADALIGQTNYEIKVAEDGKLISKKIDNEDEEKGEKKGDEKDEKGEH